MQWSAMPCRGVSATCMQHQSKLRSLFRIQTVFITWHPQSLKKTIIWIYLKENVLLQPVAESYARCLLLLQTIVWKQKGRNHTCSHGIKRLTGGLFLTPVFIPSCVLSPQATENTVDYLIALYTDGRLQFHCHFMIRSWESFQLKGWEDAWGGGGIIHCHALYFRRHH